MNNSAYELPFLPTKTIIPSPEDEDLFIPFLNRMYELFALTINQKDWRFFTFPIGSTPVNIPNIANSGAFIICVSGTQDGMPALTRSLIKTNSTAPGSFSLIQDQPGTTIGSDSTWLGKKLLISSTKSNFQIEHNATGVVGNFNIKFIGTM